MGQFPPPIFVAAMEEIASIPDTSVANRWPASGYRSRPHHTGDGRSPETGRHGGWLWLRPRTKSGFEQSQQGSPLTTPDDAIDM
jgi:hypothetical protein